MEKTIPFSNMLPCRIIDKESQILFLFRFNVVTKQDFFKDAYIYVELLGEQCIQFIKLTHIIDLSKLLSIATSLPLLILNTKSQFSIVLNL